MRYAPPDAVPGMITAEVVGTPGELPAIWVYSAMTDRLRRTDRGGAS
ncbi:hypothetical protein I552_7843 [Mycobacterium xenopi 3993]|nr:hypothetical protein I552_7843 [Mycobacterium xenopi 3993]